ncbi:transcriptional regulator [Candidatus Falkowbacteria bacterium CG10_big_fil_rev_8_21_14_0_10_43_10]|uniref:Transcriptional regulator n=1 Tax=Candidatus Falkowbacteria bacterium CG10_big_fil_rev_8_21_14_0_10_43_10 TaxID=1974567 RepID=A0A2H0V1R0_9BACT|nr:MAG: transcriptional regulator [Candidatus Falkowbacteria bacterium CG10_big_fil_rev_8_21_14_0_10_43_10]
MPIETILKKLGLSDKEIKIYLTCLQLGPAPVRKLAEQSKINRGTAYDILKSLQEKGIISFYHKDKHQYFIAEDPAVLQDVLENQKQQLEKMRDEISSAIPELRSLYDNAASKPVVKYYEGNQGVKTILRDVIESCERGSKRYYVYSSSALKSYLYSAYRNFTEDRIKANISVQSISIGPGGQTAGLDERKWLSKEKGSPTYILLYENKIAMISISRDGKPIGVIFDDKNTYETQKIIFEFIWKKL